MEQIIRSTPSSYQGILEATQLSGFNMASDILTCSLLRTLAASKPSGKFLELGTGTGLSASWILDGMGSGSTLVSVDNEPGFLQIASKFLDADQRLQLVLLDGGDWIATNLGSKFDYIFADTWHGKYLMLDEVLSMLNKGGMYIVDDMIPQQNWPDGHQEKAGKLIQYLESRTDLVVTKQIWATGIIIAVKR